MSKKIVLFQVDDQTLKENEYYFETELGWLVESGIYAKETYHIPSELEGYDPIEVLWLMRKVQDSLKYFYAIGKITNVTDELIIELVKEFIEDHEDININWHIESYLKEKSIN
jgi:hypothetical protein